MASKKCLIYEAFNDVKGMDVVSKKDGLMTLTGVFGVCGVRNNNQRVYEASNYSKMVNEMKERIKLDGGIPGELEHPQVMNITLENISHKITDINIDENGVVTGSITLLNTPKGQIAQAIVEGGLSLYISSRATGTVDSKTGSVLLDKISTYDLVGTPGFSQAKLNLNENQVVESINESAIYYITEKEENNIENDMELNEILERLESVESRVRELEQENSDLREVVESLEQPETIDLKKLGDGIQKWIVEEYSPVVQSWIIEECLPSNNEEVLEASMNNFREFVTEKLAPSIETWVVEHYSPEVEKWCVNEFAQGIQSWIVEEYAPEVEKWLNESYSIKIEGTIKDMIAESKNSNLSAIDKTLQLLESMETTKPTYSRKSIISENIDEPMYIRTMPADVRVKWDMASAEIKESINRRAKIYNFANEGAVERFWSSIDFNDIKPVNNIYEGLESVQNEYERNIRAKLRSSRFRRV